MYLYTIQLGKWRIAEAREIELLDITLMSGDRTYSPNSDLLRDFKLGLISNEQYKQRYLDLMRSSYKSNKSKWLELFNKDKLVLACYCKPGAFCHRLLMVDILNSIAVQHSFKFNYLGELT